VGVPGYYTLLGARRIKHVFGANALQAGVNAAALGWLCYAGLLSAFSSAAAASAGIAAGGTYLFFLSRAPLRGTSEISQRETV
jgi:hypothetical protein